MNLERRDKSLIGSGAYTSIFVIDYYASFNDWSCIYISPSENYHKEYHGAKHQYGIVHADLCDRQLGWEKLEYSRNGKIHQGHDIHVHARPAHPPRAISNIFSSDLLEG